jgi:hypothetical protein
VLRAVLLAVLTVQRHPIIAHHGPVCCLAASLLLCCMCIGILCSQCGHPVRHPVAGLCYGKLESAALAVLIPIWLLGHLSGLVPEAGERGLAAAIALLLAVFGSRKWTQAVKDDIGGG